MKESIILDVRPRRDYMVSHIKGAINIPYFKVDENVDLDKSKLIKVYCTCGANSKIVCGKLEKMNYDVINLGAYAEIDMEREVGYEG